MAEDKEIQSNINEHMRYIDIAKEQLIGILRDIDGPFQMRCGTRYRTATGSDRTDCMMFVPRETLKLDAEWREKSDGFKTKRHKLS